MKDCANVLDAEELDEKLCECTGCWVTGRKTVECTVSMPMCLKNWIWYCTGLKNMPMHKINK